MLVVPENGHFLELPTWLHEVPHPKFDFVSFQIYREMEGGGENTFLNV